MRTGIKIRRHWKISPRTKVKESDKVYSRRKEKARIKKDICYEDEI